MHHLSLFLRKLFRSDQTDCDPSLLLVCSHNHVGLERRLAPGAGEDALDLMQRFLRWNPSERLSAADALDHSFVSQ